MPRMHFACQYKPQEDKHDAKQVVFVGFLLSSNNKSGTNTMFNEATKLAVDAGIFAIPKRSKNKLPQITAAIIRCA